MKKVIEVKNLYKLYRVGDSIVRALNGVDFEIYEKIYLLTAYTKNEKDNLTKEECTEIKKMISVLEQQLKDNNK